MFLFCQIVTEASPQNVSMCILTRPFSIYTQICVRTIFTCSEAPHTIRFRRKGILTDMLVTCRWSDKIDRGTGRVCPNGSPGLAHKFWVRFNIWASWRKETAQLLKLSVSTGSSSVNMNNVLLSVRMTDLLPYDASSTCVEIIWALESENPKVENDALLLMFVTWELLTVKDFYF